MQLPRYRPIPPAILSRTEVIDRVMLVIRRRGYEGASFAELSKATGLGKSSLYYHFPNGKDEMVRAVLEHLRQQLRDTIFVPLRGGDTPYHRLHTMVTGLNAFYRGGQEACVLANLVVGDTRDRFRQELHQIFDEWIDAVAVPLIDAGFSPSLARARAEDTILRIEGALILGRALESEHMFTRALEQLPAELLAPPVSQQG